MSATSALKSIRLYDVVSYFCCVVLIALIYWNINMARNTHHTPLMSSSNWNVENLPYLLKASDLPAGQVKVPHGSTGRAS